MKGSIGVGRSDGRKEQLTGLGVGSHSWVLTNSGVGSPHKKRGRLVVSRGKKSQYDKGETPGEEKGATCEEEMKGKLSCHAPGRGTRIALDEGSEVRGSS